MIKLVKFFSWRKI